MLRLIAACVAASMCGTLTVWLMAAGAELAAAGHPSTVARDALLSLIPYLAFGWPLALLACVLGGLPVYAWLRRSGRLDRRTVVIAATALGIIMLPAMGAVGRWDSGWGHPLLYVWGGCAGLAAGTVFVALMPVRR